MKVWHKSPKKKKNWRPPPPPPPHVKSEIKWYMYHTGNQVYVFIHDEAITLLCVFTLILHFIVLNFRLEGFLIRTCSSSTLHGRSYSP